MANTTFTGPVRSLNGFVSIAPTSGKSLTIQAPAALAANTTLTFPDGAGSNGQVLTTNGTGTLTWTTNGAGTVTSVGGTGAVSGLTLTGTVTSSGSLTLGGALDLTSPPAIGATAPNTAAFSSLTMTNTSSSTSLYQPMVVTSTLTGVGVTGGRAKFDTTINSAAGSFTNALKANVTYGTSGSTSGLGSAFVAELTLSAGTSAGTYAPLEIELNVPSGASLGTATSLLYTSVNGAAATTFDDSGYIMNVAGVTAGASKAFANNGSIGDVNEIKYGLKVKIAGAEYFILMADAADFAD